MKRLKSYRKILRAVGLSVIFTNTAGCTDKALETDKAVNVEGTFSAGSSHQWEALKPVVFSRDKYDEKIDTVITVDPETKYQEYQGIGISLDETSVSNLWKLSEENREEVIKKLVDPEAGAGLQLFRITIGSPDCIEHLPFWSYDELPEGVAEDWNLKCFSIEKDRKYHIIDTVKLIQKYNPNAQFFASAWSAPAWMKTKNTFTGYAEVQDNGSTVQGNKLRDDCINVFARYYVKTIQAYAKEGINIRAITLLNEPGIDVIYPAMDISIPQQQKLALEIKSEFAKAGLNTELWMHDFNFWDWKDPNSTETKNYYRVFEDSAVAEGEEVVKAADGVAFHPYWGDAGVMADVVEEFPKIKVHLTETNVFSPSTILEYLNKYASSYTGWVGITDQNGGTLYWTDSRDNNIDWGTVIPSWRDRLVTVNTETNTATYVDNFYGIGQFSKYIEYGGINSDGSVRQGARRIFSTGTVNGVSNVAFQNPSGEIVMVLINDGAARNIKVQMTEQSFVQNIPANSTTTLRWNPQLSKLNK